MLSELLQDRAALYVAGAMTAAERENFELMLEFHEELRSHVAGLREAMTAVALNEVRGARVSPPAALKARILASLDLQPAKDEPEAVVVTGPDRLVHWINPAFTAMCGYSLEELRGRKPGALLQGRETDLEAVGRIREALREKRPCRETLVNYHKDGSAYRVDLRIAPVLDDEGSPLWFVARERKLADLAATG
jgi:PAS domain S-box-containing protein